MSSASALALKGGDESSPIAFQIRREKDSLLTGSTARPIGHKSTTGGKTNHTGEKQLTDTQIRVKGQSGHARVFSRHQSPTSDRRWGRKTICHDTHSGQKGGNSNQVRLTTTDKTNKNKCPETKMSKVKC